MAQASTPISQPMLLWNDVFDLLCQAKFQELASQNISRRWHYIDRTTFFLVSATASGSAIAGWALWLQPSGRIIWAAVAGFTSLLSLVHATLQVPTKMKQQDEVYRLFLDLSLDIDQFRAHIRNDIRAGLLPKNAQQSYDELYGRYTKCMKLVPSTAVVTHGLQRKTKDQVKELLKSQMKEE